MKENSSGGHLYADGVACHLVKVWVLSCCAVEEFSPEQLPVQGEWGLALLYLPVQGGCSTCLLDEVPKTIENNKPIEIGEGVVEEAS